MSYNIESDSILVAELTYSFSNKFIEQTGKLINQFKTQMSENCFDQFVLIYCEYVALYIENYLKFKRFSTYGSLVLEKVFKSDYNRILIR